MKLPKGIKKMRAAASDETLSNALSITTSTGFNGYIRTTAPKGVKEASVIIFIDGGSKLAVFQSPRRSLYGPDALHEVKRISNDPKSTIRVEEFLAQNMDEVNGIVNKMRKAHVEAIDIEKVLMGIDVEVEDDEGSKVGAEERIADAIDIEMKETEPETEDDDEEGEPKDPDEETPEEPPKVGRVRARMRDRITRSQETAAKDDEEFLTMMKEAGMSPPGEGEPVDDEVNQYIAAFEDFIQRTGDDVDVDAEIDVTVELTNAVDDILDEMIDAASDDPDKMEFIESQRDRILAKFAASQPAVTAKDRHHRLSDQQVALEHISGTFSEVLTASEAEAERRRNEIEERRDSGDAEKDWLDGEERGLEEDLERHTSLASILDRVMDTHRERLDGAEVDMFDEEAEIEAASRMEEEKDKQELDLEGAKEEFLSEMRTRIHTVATENGDEIEPGKVAEAVHEVSEDIDDHVDELEQEHDVLTKERQILEDQAEVLKEKVDHLEVDLEIEVQARLRDLEEKEIELQARVKDSEELEGRLANERSKIEKDLENARSELERVGSMEAALQEREDLLSSREKELTGKHDEVEGLKEHLEDEIARRASDLEGLEGTLKAQEKELLAKEDQVTKAMETLKKEREEGVETDLKRVKEVEEELKNREVEYSDTISNLEAVIEALRDELRENIENNEALETQLAALHETAERVVELEEQLASVPEGAEGTSDTDKEELRRLLAYLDDLLSKLPEKEIEKFSKTEYFELYGKILDKLGI